MAISTKSELHTAVTNWLNRSDLTSRIPEFITLAEASFNRNLRTRQPPPADVPCTSALMPRQAAGICRRCKRSQSEPSQNIGSKSIKNKTVAEYIVDESDQYHQK